MEFSKVLNLIVSSCPFLSGNEYDGIIIKKLAATNTISDTGASHQSHMAFTGKQKNFFPFLNADGYFNVGYESKDDDLKKYFTLQIPLTIYKENTDALTNKLFNLIDYSSGKKVVKASVLRSRRNNADDQIELSIKSLDDEDFIEFRKLLRVNDFFVLLKKKNCLEYDLIGIRSTDKNAENLSKCTDFYKLPTQTPVNIKCFEINSIQNTPSIPFPHNRIVFGAPGTGKSHSLKENSSFFENQDIVEDESTKIKNQYTLCNTYGDFVRLGMLYADCFKEKTVSQIAEELKSKRAYWIKKGSVLKNELNDIPNYTEEEFSEKVVDFIKNIPHGKKETLGVALGYKYSNLFSDVSIETLKERYQAVPSVASWILYGVQAAQSNIDKESNSKTKFIERVTFHPNYSYSQFVGTYKPVQDFVDEKQITYQYVPGPFIRIYSKAKKNPKKNYLLIIEEINRANVAAVFGDVFQLLDRKSDGESEYKIAVSEDIKKYLAKNGIYEDELSIPSNMYIWATMNSADQGVFPMDTAFKRRWEFEYIGIDENEEGVKEFEIPINSNQKINWNELRKAINDKLIELSVNEDKLLGPFFLSKNILENAMKDIESFIKLFKSKVIMYLFEDAAKLKVKQLFKIDSSKYIFSEICKQFDEKGLDIFQIDALEIKISNINDTKKEGSVSEGNSETVSLA